jgi:uncharacterized protein RhaS with RHS repeats
MSTNSEVYDAQGRLISDSNWSYTYKKDGRVKRKSLKKGQYTSGNPEVYDVHDLLISDANWTYTYNKNGHLTRKDHKTNDTYVTYSYDALGNLLTVQFSNGTKVDYLVDGSDRRVQRRLNNTSSERAMVWWFSQCLTILGVTCCQIQTQAFSLLDSQVGFMMPQPAL